MEKWLTIDGYMDTFFGLFSALGSLTAGFAAIWAIKLAKGYLEEHKEKLKEENRQKIIIICLQLVSKLRIDYHKLYTFQFNEIFNESNNEELDDFLSRRIQSHRNNRETLNIVTEQEIQLHSYLSVLNDDDLLRVYNLQLELTGQIQDYIQQIVYLASDNNYSGSYEKMKALANHPTEEGRLLSLSSLYDALQSMRDRLLSLYHGN